ncbi:ead/Ea22-like family protein [Serratia bockelmannii]|uniref:ead/Ea22-like family protein n=1 Tax=Serratia bockelmannii TaxID=2703793 RepID=UPI0011C8E14D|nr:ead/Ea22-like family protein [Serratia bockelmannii]TXE47857.1 ead/Ea22-like family protein [Serratia bockelmannii]
MDNKLSALKLRADKCPIKRFKAFIGKANTQATLCADTGIEIIDGSGFDASDLTAKSQRVELARFVAAADPETILALLAELETKEKRIAELEKRLATPVRLPSFDCYKPEAAKELQEGFKNTVRAAGFTVEGRMHDTND